MLPRYVLVCAPIWMQAATGRVVGRPFGFVRSIVHDNRRQRRQTSSMLSRARDLLTQNVMGFSKTILFKLLICRMALSASSGFANNIFEMREWFIDIVVTKIIIIIHQRRQLSDGSRNFSQINRFAVYTICVGDSFGFVRIVESFRARRNQWMAL